MNKGKIILLNGVSSSGKSTLAKELIKEMPDSFHMSIDDFDIFIDKVEDRANNRLIPVETEYFFHRTIRMFSDRGINLIVDEVLHDEFTRDDFLKALSDYPILLVGIHCPIEELERRELARGDREPGLARKQLEYVHKNKKYHVEVNTFTEDIKECSRKIIEKMNNIDK